MDLHEASVADIVAGKLSDDSVPDQVARLILDAMRGSASEAEAGNGRQSAGLRRVYLKSISVEGFRGIGPQATLYLTPGPGLTVVTGRNGSGKSSFAEAAELALTGENKRWEDRTAVWKEGWRNLHTPKKEPTAIALQLTEDGISGTTTVTRDWASGAALDSANEHVWIGDSEQSLTDKGWARPLELYRPFLSYSELGALVSGRPSSMHDAMQAILGLDLLTSMEKRLTEERRTAEADAKAAKNELPALLAKLAAHPDERARLAERAIGGREKDLTTLDTLIVADDVAGDGLVGVLKEVAAITLPTSESVAAAVDRLVAARAAVAALVGTRAADARRLAGLLIAAVEHQRSHADKPCPVCGGRLLDKGWAAATKDSIAELTTQAAQADSASAEETAAVSVLGRLVPPKPAVLRADLGPGLDPAAASAAWDRWAADIAAITSVGASSADGVISPKASESTPAFDALSTAVTGLRSSADQALQDRAAAWLPLARDLAAWSDLARKGNAASVRANDLRKAIDWLRAVGKEVRNARLAPFARTSAAVWETLRQESNVELGPITLAGAGPMRKVTLDVTVDGMPGAPLSVMSQGELHALGLALFLPRATAADSRFGFVVIDDPVQAMDPAKVDGLARVLSSVAAEVPAGLRALGGPPCVNAFWDAKKGVHDSQHGDLQRFIDETELLARALRK